MPQEYLSQDIPTDKGRTYQLSFWLKNNEAGSAEFAIAFGDPQPTVLAVSNPPAGTAPQLDSGALTLSATTAFNWTQYGVAFTASAATTTVKFAFRNDPGYWCMDDASMFVTEPCTQADGCEAGKYCDAGFCRTCASADPRW